MPDVFPHSPYKDHPTIVGWAQASGNRRWADLLDPSHPAYDPRYLVAYRRKTAKHNGISVEQAEAAERTSPRAFPPLATQARNFAGAVVRAARSGGKRVTPEQHAERMATCEACPNKKGNRCALCGCGLRAKAALASESCPIGKWPTLNPPAS